MSFTPLSTVTHIVGDLFAAPRNSILVHACNAQGSWGGGIAVEFHNRFPAAFQTYRAHCLAHDADAIMGTCLLISGAEDSHDVACLFTSRRYGARKDKPTDILCATEAALQDLVKQNISGKELHACRFNSGKFGVPWSDTEAVIQRVVGATMTIYTPPAPPPADASAPSSSSQVPTTASRGSSRARGRARARGRGARQMTLGAFGIGERSARSARGSGSDAPTKSRDLASSENDPPSL